MRAAKAVVGLRTRATREESWDHQAAIRAEAAIYCVSTNTDWLSISGDKPHKLHLEAGDQVLERFAVQSGGRVFYPSYADAPRVASLSPLNDQIAAGAFMWVFGSLIYLIPAVVIVFRLVDSDAPSRAYKSAVSRAT